MSGIETFLVEHDQSIESPSSLDLLSLSLDGSTRTVRAPKEKPSSTEAAARGFVEELCELSLRTSKLGNGLTETLSSTPASGTELTESLTCREKTNEKGQEKQSDKEPSSDKSKSKVSEQPLSLLSGKITRSEGTMEFSDRLLCRIVRKTDGEETDLKIKRSWIRNDELTGVYFNKGEGKNAVLIPYFEQDPESRLFRKFENGKPTNELGSLHISNRGVITFINRTLGQREVTDYFAPKGSMLTKTELKSDLPMPLKRGELASVAEKIFDSIDKDKNGYLTVKELNAALENPTFKGKEAQVVAALYSKHSSLSSWSGISRSDLKKFQELDIKQEKAWAYQQRRVRDVYSYADRTAANQLEGLSKSLYEDPRNPGRSIKVEAIKGRSENSYFLATLAAVAISNAELIEKMIKDNKDGTYTVTFPGATDEPITVKQPTEAEMGLFNQPGRHGLWANVLEKAYGKYCQKSVYRRAPLNLSGGSSPTEGAFNTTTIDPVLTLLTGKSVKSKVNASEDELRDIFTAAFKHPRTPVVCESYDAGGITYDKFRAPRAYTVIDFDPDSGEGGTVTVRNPLGGDEGTPSGTVRLSLATFRRNLQTVKRAEK